jgi:hypothetical protein
MVVKKLNGDLFFWLDEIAIYFLKLELFLPNSLVHELRACAVNKIEQLMGRCIAFFSSR